MSDSQVISNFAGISSLAFCFETGEVIIVSEKINQKLNAYFSYGILMCQAILKISFFRGETEVKCVKCYSRFRATPTEAFYVGPRSRTSRYFPPDMRNVTFEFSLTISRRCSRRRCLKSLTTVWGKRRRSFLSAGKISG